MVAAEMGKPELGAVSRAAVDGMALSIVLPCHNEVESLPPLVDEIRGVPGLPAALEIILVDDGSTDGTPEAIKSMAEGDPRVRAVLLAEHVTAVRAAGLSPQDRDAVFAVLSVEWQGSEDPEDPSGTLRIILSGDGEIAVDAEYLDLRLEDVTRPYAAPSGLAPEHED